METDLDIFIRSLVRSIDVLEGREFKFYEFTKKNLTKIYIVHLKHMVEAAIKLSTQLKEVNRNEKVSVH